MPKSKYIILADSAGREYLITFDEALGHKDIAEAVGAINLSGWSHVNGAVRTVAAGFIENGVVTAQGSESLKLNPRPQDQALIDGTNRDLTAKDLPMMPLSVADMSRLKVQLAPKRPQKSFLERARGAKAR